MYRGTLLDFCLFGLTTAYKYQFSTPIHAGTSFKQKFEEIWLLIWSVGQSIMIMGFQIDLWKDGCGNNSWEAFCHSRQCVTALQTEIAGTTIRMGGIAKGSGMIHPNMATMLSVITTDANVSSDVWKGIVARGASNSFNQVQLLQKDCDAWANAHLYSVSFSRIHVSFLWCYQSLQAASSFYFHYDHVDNSLMLKIFCWCSSARSLKILLRQTRQISSSWQAHMSAWKSQVYWQYEMYASSWWVCKPSFSSLLVL